VLAVASLLTSVLAPAIGDFVNGARLVKARSDMQVIAVGLTRFAFDVSLQRNTSGSWSGFDVLVGAGQTPAPGDTDASPWTAELSTGRAGQLDDYLVRNQAGDERRTARFGGGMFSRGWAGPYLDAGVGPDPWGYRYAVSVRHLVDGSGWDAVVLSAGPDAIVETAFNSRAASTDSGDLGCLLAPGY